jgi:hypothetical protein
MPRRPTAHQFRASPALIAPDRESAAFAVASPAPRRSWPEPRPGGSWDPVERRVAGI